MEPAATLETPALTPHVALRRVEVIVNPRSGGVGAKALPELESLLDAYPLDVRIRAFESGPLEPLLETVFDAAPDLIIVLAGDGTACAVASRAGPDGPLVAPLPGGTMNMLPRAVYGTTDWKEALRAALVRGEPKMISGGRVDGHPFYCAAVLGAPALWAPAREALRERKAKLAWLYGRRALRRAFSGRIRYRLDGGAPRRAEALVLISPLISSALDKPAGLEAAAMTLTDAREAFRLAARAVFSDWRADPAVETRVVRRVDVQARSRIPAILDGETVHLDDQAEVRFIPRAFRALSPVPEPPPEDAGEI